MPLFLTPVAALCPHNHSLGVLSVIVNSLSAIFSARLLFSTHRLFETMNEHLAPQQRFVGQMSTNAKLIA